MTGRAVLDARRMDMPIEVDGSPDDSFRSYPEVTGSWIIRGLARVPGERLF
jgi:hypothetical protein